MEETKNIQLPKTYSEFTSLGAKHPFTIGVAAPIKAGKTHLIRNLIKHCWADEFDNIVIISPTLEYEEEYPIEEMVNPDTNVIKIRTNLYEQVCRVIAEQKELALKHKKNPDSCEPTRTLFIADDCLDSKLFMGNRTENVFDQMICRGRHFEASSILISQTLSVISSVIRRNLEYLFIFAPLNFSEMERILDEYVPHEYRVQFRQAVREMFQQPHAFLVIDGTKEKRTDFKKRLRKGFTELIFPMEEDEPSLTSRVVPSPYLKEEDTS